VSGLRIMEHFGIRIHRLRHLHLHGKLLMVDGKKAILGSINLAPGSFDDRRELAIEIEQEDIVHQLKQVMHDDWERSVALDLTDQGLYDDLDRRGRGELEPLIRDLETAHKK
jgi:cardiolipin synthase